MPCLISGEKCLCKKVKKATLQLKISGNFGNDTLQLEPLSEGPKLFSTLHFSGALCIQVHGFAVRIDL